MATYFAALKQAAGQDEPDPDAAALVGRDDAAEAAAAGNAPGLALLRKLPGVTEANVYALARRAGSLCALAAMPPPALAAVVGEAAAAALHAFLHCRHAEAL